MAIASSEGIEGKRRWRNPFLHNLESEGGFKDFVVYFFGIFKYNKDGGLKPISFYTFGGYDLLFQGIICIIADCVLSSVFFTFVLLPVSTNLPRRLPFVLNSSIFTRSQYSFNHQDL